MALVRSGLRGGFEDLVGSDALAEHLPGGRRVAFVVGPAPPEVEWRDTPGGAAADSTGPLKGGNALRQLVLLKARRFASLAFMGPTASMTSLEADRFFKSLKMK